MAAVDAPHVADADLARTAPIVSAAASDPWTREPGGDVPRSTVRAPARR